MGNKGDYIKHMQGINYWDLQPCNIKHSDKPVGTKEYFDEVEMRKYFVENHIPGFAEFGKWRGKRVLDLGCGIGTDTVSFAKYGAEVVAIDSSQKSVDLTRKRVIVYGLQDKVEVRWLNAEDLFQFMDWPLEHFDLIYCFGVLHHMKEPDECLRNIYPQLENDGELRLMVYNKWSWKNLRIKLGLDQPEAQPGCPVWRTYSKRGIRKLLENTGFRVIEIKVKHVFPYKIKEYKEYKYVKTWWSYLVPEWLGWHLCVKAVKNADRG